jgi:hypothetical protein
MSPFKSNAVCDEGDSATGEELTTAIDVNITFSSPANGGNGWTIFGNSATTTSLQEVAQCLDKSTIPQCITHLYFCPDDKRKLL